MPNLLFSKENLTYIRGLRLADPDFNKPGRIDMLLGADIFSTALMSGRRKGGPDDPVAFQTEFGWALIGKINLPTNHVQVFHSTSNAELDVTIRKFWEVEEIPNIQKESPDDVFCERLFVTSCERDHTGRFTVALPFKGPEPTFENSRPTALRRLLLLERRLDKDPALCEAYRAFMKDYLDSGHMEIVSSFPSNSPLNKQVYYIPHHCVVRPESASTKVRVVFDASAVTPDGRSLNDTLLVGPKLQKDIAVLLLHFRLHKYVITADIKQMYRQIWLSKNHQDYQRILWRFHPNEPVREYRLKTVTYGVASAPFLALRTLIELAKLEEHKYPIAAKALANDTYVDDIVTGTNSVEEAKQLHSELQQLLESGGFKLHKWCTNNKDILPNTSTDEHQHLSFDDDNFVKILGLQWHPQSDCFTYTVKPLQRECTKRAILSELARIFDPLGFLAPLTFFAKVLIQRLWCLGLKWDDIPPDEILQTWNKYLHELPLLTNLKISRHVIPEPDTMVELHGFCDASETGFGAVIYFRFLTVNSEVQISQICAKSKVAPLKKISLPRLELCGAVLLAELISYVQKTYHNKVTITKVFAWCDSTVALTWIRSSPHRWKTFVANRVSRIQELIAPSSWHHVRSNDNPADCASRGLFPEELLQHSLWWAGPSWLKQHDENWSSADINTTLDSEETVKSEERKTVLTSIVVYNVFDNLLTKYSSFSKIQRIVAYIRRFINKCRKSKNCRDGHFTEHELHEATLSLAKYVQATTFHKELEQIKNGQLTVKPIQKLNPFIDSDGLVRVGGRLVNSEIAYDAKHPVLLPRVHRFTELLIQYFHVKYLHVGLQTLHFLIRQQFWILSAKRIIRKCLSHCIPCFRAKPATVTPLMGNLPAPRVTQVKAFLHTGVDFAGPVTVKAGKHRGAKLVKAYICIFVCLAVKAVHLELVSDLSSEAFIAALRRFVARRGRCSNLYSDCGTNFVGANNELKKYAEQAAETMSIKWSFNPPSAPNFGGLWEAGVRSIKHHLVRVIGSQVLTFEEFYTILVQIEAILNSRPLFQLSSDPNDLNVLTPGHFLVLEPLSAVPDENLDNVKINRLNRWQLIQRCQQDFWKRWHGEYLHTLQQRSKWQKVSREIPINTVVLIKDDNSPPLQWRLGKIIQLHPGKDGVTRVATVRTSKGTLMQRPMSKLCPLPTQDILD